MDELVKKGLTKFIGVSNFDVALSKYGYSWRVFGKEFVRTP